MTPDISNKSDWIVIYPVWIALSNAWTTKARNVNKYFYVLLTKIMKTWNHSERILKLKVCVFL